MSWDKDPCSARGAAPILAIFLSLFICVLALIIEGAAHTKFYSTNKGQEGTLIPPAALRSKRFAIVSVLFIPLTVAFPYRIEKGALPGCPYPNDEAGWWLLTIFSIIPFINASCAWLRTLVDCVVMRFGMTLECPLTGGDGARKNALRNGKQEGILWWPILGIIGVVVTTIVYLAKAIAGLAMGKYGSNKEQGDVEEGIELINNDLEHEEGELPPYALLQEAQECSK